MRRNSQACKKRIKWTAGTTLRASPKPKQEKAGRSYAGREGRPGSYGEVARRTARQEKRDNSRICKGQQDTAPAHRPCPLAERDAERVGTRRIHQAFGSPYKIT